MFMKLAGPACVIAALAVWTAPVPAATLSGEVRIEGSKRLKNLVVYLEAASEATRIEAAKHARVSQRGRMFAPHTLVIVKGGTVDFVNDEEREIDHNVYSLSKGNRFDIGLAPRGVTHKVRFDEPGIVKYFCSVHKNMEGTIIVVPSPFYAVIKRPGRFEIRDVPPGEWVVKVSVTHRRYKSEAVPVSVAASPVEDVLVKLSRKR